MSTKNKCNHENKKTFVCTEVKRAQAKAQETKNFFFFFFYVPFTPIFISQVETAVLQGQATAQQLSQSK